jgi:hypothetical protein
VIMWHTHKPFFLCNGCEMQEIERKLWVQNLAILTIKHDIAHNEEKNQGQEEHRDREITIISKVVNQ